MAQIRKRRLWWKRFKGFARSYARSKLGLAGLVIMLLFVGMAVFAPYLTPYDPVLDYRLANGDLPPTWLNQLGGQPYAPFITTPAHPNFGSGASLSEWRLFTSSTNSSVAYTRWNGTQGYLDPTQPEDTQLGSIQVGFSRTTTGFTANDTIVKLSSTFNWPAGATVPSSFNFNYDYLVELSGSVGYSIAFYIQLPNTDPNAICRSGIINLTASPCVTLSNSSYVWNPTITINHSESWDYIGPIFANNNTRSYWHQPTSLDSVRNEIKYWFGTGEKGNLYTAKPTQTLFTRSGDFAFVIQISFYDTNAATPARASIILDDTYLQVKGNTWGLLGLDEYGHDLWSQLLFGSRISLIIGTVAALVAVVLGLLVGVAAGYFGGAADQVLMRISDVLLTIPFLPLVLVLTIMLATTQGRSYTTLIIALGVLGWAGVARIIRAQVLSVKEITYVEAARAIGASDGHILTKHIIPNVSPLIWVNLALAVPGAIVTEAAISFLGFGDPTHVSWGIILYNAQIAGNYTLWWRFVPAGICIALVSLAFLLIGYSLDEILNPRLRAR